MHLGTLVASVCLLISGAAAVSAPNSALAAGMSASNFYGAPIPPWKPNCKPGWYYGRPESCPPNLFSILDNLLCKVLDLLGIHLCPVGRPPLPPTTITITATATVTTTATTTTTTTTTTTPPTTTPPTTPCPPGYTNQPINSTCAIAVWPVVGNYLTYGLVETILACAVMCDTVSGCIYFNTYHDNNAGSKQLSPLLTCSMFAHVFSAADAVNCGGQQQIPLPGEVTRISESKAFYKYKAVATK